MNDLLAAYNASMEKWYSETSRYANGQTNNARDAMQNAYLLPCERQHSITYKHLKALIAHSEGKTGLEVSVFFSLGKVRVVDQIPDYSRNVEVFDLTQIV